MNIFKLSIYALLTFLIASCANRAEGPTGGLKDSIPPVIVRTYPENGAVNYRKKEIQVIFNENISLEKVNEQAFISPPQKIPPIIKANARTLTVNLEDEITDSTTYSIYFGNAIVDLNERNVFKNYNFSFSTGNEIDTLQVSGMLYNAENLEPMSGVVVGLHRNLNDTAIFKDQFLRASRTDDEGRFEIKNIKAGTYKIFALKDNNKDLLYQLGESIAFNDSLVIPYVQTVQKSDTIMKDSVSIDTVLTTFKTSYYPDNIVLRLFKENKKRQYLKQFERPDKYRFSLIFNDIQLSKPLITPLNFDLNTKFLLQANQQLDSLHYWITDSIIYNLDTLKLAVHYQKTDSLFNRVVTTDTLNLSYKKTLPVKSKQQTIPVKSILNFSTNLQGDLDLFNDIHLTSDEPLDSLVRSGIRIREEVDTIYKDLQVNLIYKDSINRNFALRYPWKPKSNYEIIIDSASLHSIYGKVNKPFQKAFKTKSNEDYSVFKIKLNDFDSLAVIQLLDSKESVVSFQKAKKEGNIFEFLNPADYFVRLFIDKNQNSKWDTGDLTKSVQPEDVYYFRKKITLKANWEQEESWSHINPDQKYQKPEDLKKKPKK